MDRRNFLSTTAGTFAGLTTGGAGLAEARQGGVAQSTPAPTASRIALASAWPSSWIIELWKMLQAQFDATIVSWAPVGSKAPEWPQDLKVNAVDVDNRDDLGRLLAGHDVLLLVLPDAGAVTPEARVEEATRRTYGLLQAAVSAGTKAVCFFSTLAMFELYDEDFLVDEDWQPRAIDHDHGLAEYLAEFVCREFAREKLLRVVILRLGQVIDEPLPPAEARRRGWVFRSDVAQGVARAVEILRSSEREKLRWWTCIHIAGSCPPSRFPTKRAERLLGYRPQQT